MIKRIKKINKLGVFTNFQCDDEIKDFSQVNVIYGWNGTGKSTLAHLLSSLNDSKSNLYPDFEYQIQTDTGEVKNPNPLIIPIRVFDKSYIERNIQLIEGKASAIYILGEENQEIAEEVENLSLELERRKTALSELQTEKEQKNNAKSKVFTDIAKLISISIGGNLSRTYRKPQALEGFKTITDHSELSEKDIEIHQNTLKQEQKESVNLLSLGKTVFEEKEFDIVPLIEEIKKRADIVAKKVVSDKRVERLIKNADISDWVEEGLGLHKKHSSNKCEYCLNEIASNRQSDLQTHFSKEDQEIKTEIDLLSEALSSIKKIVNSLYLPDKANLYTEFQTKYQRKMQDFTNQKTLLISEIDSSLTEIKNKKTKTNQIVELTSSVSITPFLTSLESINELFIEHNNKTETFSKKKEEATESIEKHYLSSIKSEVDEIDKNISSIDKAIEELNNGVDIIDKDSLLGYSVNEIKRLIKEKKAVISSEHKACEEINKKLSIFLGRDELKFEVSEGGYAIKRKDKMAYNLSEGEKTAIALIYFLIQLQDQDFTLSDGIVVIDDPISSLDSGSIFQAFSLIKNSVKEAKQVFILTHNFDFLRHLINWLNHARLPKEYFMITNKFVDGERQADIKPLDRLLQEHESEYQYLFKRLYNFKSDGTIESVYDIPNLARKVLDTFLMFTVPNNLSQYRKLESIDFDEEKKTSIYKFVNDQSHITGKGFDPSLVQETQNCVSLLLEMIENVFPLHYNALVKSIS